jgi:ATP-dependent Clp protease protease subunit
MNQNKLLLQLGNMNTTSKVDELLYAEKLENRELYLPEVVEDDIIAEIAEHIIRYNKEDKDLPVEQRKPIKIFINCYGGDLVACNTIINTIQLSKTPVYTYNLGKAWSAGGLIFIAGHKRFTYKDSVVLIHQGSSGASGTTGQVIDQVEFQKRQEERVKAYILGNTKITPEQYKDKYKEEWFFFGDESIELGVADELISSLEF